LLPLVFVFFDFAGTGFGGAFVAIAIFAKSMYVQMGLGRILQADALGLSGPERSQYLERAGGVSVVAGTLAGFVFAAMLGFAILALFAPSLLPAPR
jgi:hypothetical protein